MGIVVDTGVFIHWERTGRVVDFSRWADFGAPCVSVITASELKVGVHRANTPERRARRLQFVEAVLSGVSVLTIDSPIAEIHAGIVAVLTMQGNAIGPHDFWIAATALHHDFEILTANATEFQRVPNLRVIDFLNST